MSDRFSLKKHAVETIKYLNANDTKAASDSYKQFLNQAKNSPGYAQIVLDEAKRETNDFVGMNLEFKKLGDFFEKERKDFYQVFDKMYPHTKNRRRAIRLSGCLEKEKVNNINKRHLLKRFYYVVLDIIKNKGI